MLKNSSGLNKALKLAITLSFVFLIVPQKAHAYLDPGTGSYLIQIIIASVAGAGYFLKINWGKIKDIFSKKSRKKTENEKEDE